MVKLDTVHSSNRNFIILTKHRRLKRLWQFFFTGWGLVMIVALIAGTLFSRQLLWTPISTISMNDIVSKQFRMTGASFVGTDKNGQPFRIQAKTGYQEYDNPDIVFMDVISGRISRISNGQRITDDIKARKGKYNRVKRTITLIGNVHVDSSNGDKIRTDELVITL